MLSRSACTSVLSRRPMDHILRPHPSYRQTALKAMVLVLAYRIQRAVVSFKIHPSFVVHPILLRHPNGGAVVGINDGNQAAKPEIPKTMLFEGAGGFCRQSLSPVGAGNHIGDLHLLNAIKHLPEEPAPSDELPVLLVNGCQEIHFRPGILPDDLLQFLAGQLPGACPFEETHDFGIGIEGGEIVYIL